MEPSSGNKPSKKVNFEDLQKEELVQKCYHLLDIAQKAKYSKSILQEEVQTLKTELTKTKSVSSGTEEVLNTLIEKNLILTMTVDKLTSSNKLLSQKLEQTEIKLNEYQDQNYLLDNENSSFKRQIGRLVQENEQLLGNLDVLEKQIEKLNQLGFEQNTQLLHLESQHSTEKNDVVSTKDSQNIHLSEIEKLTLDKEALCNKVIEFEQKIIKSNNTIKELEEEFAKKDLIVANLSTKLLELEKALVDSNSENELLYLKAENATTKEKLKMYHSKIVKFAGIVKVLREDKTHILELSKSYIDQVQVWKGQLQSAKEKCLCYIKQLEDENQDIKLKLTLFDENQQHLLTSFAEEKRMIEEKLQNEILYYQKEIESLNEKCNQMLILIKTLNDTAEVNVKLKTQLDNLNQEIAEYKQELEDLRDKKKSAIIKERNEQNLLVGQEMKIEMDKLRSGNEENIKQIEHLRNSEVILKTDLKNNQTLLDEYKSKLNIYDMQGEDSVKQINKMQNMLMSYENELSKIKAEHAAICESENNLLNKLKTLEKEKDIYIAQIKCTNEKYDLLLIEHSDEKSNYEEKLKALSHEMKSHQELEMKSTNEIEKLMHENKILLSKIEQFKEELVTIKNIKKDISDTECQTELNITTEVEQQLSDLKRENAELLKDMNEMNQELKDRGENISKLSAHCEEVLKKLQTYETQANKNVDNIFEKEKIIESLKKEIETLTLTEDIDNDKNDEITQLKNEIQILKEKLNQNIDSSNADIETMSTSTISRVDEINRLKDLEGSWEERYGKLRALAIKLKGKIRELSNNSTQQLDENEELQKKLSVNIRTIQSLQSNCDSLKDELDKSRTECKIYLNKLNESIHDISNDKQQLVSKDEIINDLQQKVEQFNKEKQSTENWKKQVSVKIQMLRKDLEAKEFLRKELEIKITELNSELQKKEELMKTESDSHDHTKSLLEQLNDQCKKNSMLSLEMQDYERSMKEITKKIDRQQEQVVSLKSQIDSQKAIIEKLKDENKTLQESVSDKEKYLLSGSSEIEMYRNKITKFEETITEKVEQIDSLTKLLESARAEVEELSIEISKMIAEHQKTDECLKNERDQLRSQNVILQQNFRELQNNLSMKIAELENIQTDYEGYKIRAQSVLKQNLNRDIGLEEKLLEEINTLKTQNLSLAAELDNYKYVSD